MQASRAVLITYARDGSRFRASGLHLREDLVLTAEHCAGGTDYAVWVGGVEHQAVVAWRSGTAAVDLAMLKATGLPDVDPIPIALLERADADVLEGCICVCYPSFKRPDRTASPAGMTQRGDDRAAQLLGAIPLAENSTARFGMRGGSGSGANAVLVIDSARSTLPQHDGSSEEINAAWVGASGGAVVVNQGGRESCVGVVSAREVKETPGALQVATFAGLRDLPPDQKSALLALLGLGDLAHVRVLGGLQTRTGQVVTGNRPQQAPDFVERAATRRVLDSLEGAGPAALMTLTGLRGVGKSQVAAGVARRCQDQGWPVVAWVNATSRENVELDLGSVAEQLGFAREAEPPASSIARMLNTWNSAPDPQRLLVFDNLADASTLDGLLPNAGAATVLVTTATRAAVVGELVDVEAFTSEQAVEYLEQRTSLGDPDGAGLLAEQLGRLPVALAQASWTLTRRRLTYRQYLDVLARLPLTTSLPPERGLAYPVSTGAALTLSIQTALDASPDPDLTRAVLDTLAVLDSGGVPRRWFSVLGDEFAVGEVLAVLEDSSLAIPSADGTNVIMHGLVAKVIRDCQSEPHAAAAARDAVVAIVKAVQPLARDTYWERRTEATELATHLEALNGDSPTLSDDASVISACIGCGNALKELRDPYRAAALLRSALSNAERVLGPDDPETLASRDYLASAYVDTGDLSRATPLYVQTLAGRERVLGTDHPDTLTSRSNLAYAYQEAGDLPRAIRLYVQTLADRERVLGPDHPATMISRSNLATAYHAAGERGPALELFEQALADRERILGPDHPHTLGSRTNLAAAYEAVGDLSRALSLSERTLADRERVLGPDHPDTLSSRSNLAFLHQKSGDLGLAISLYERTLADRERVLGPGHPETLDACNNLAHALQESGNLSGAIPLYEQTLAERERVLGTDHPGTLASRSNLAFAYQAAGDLGRAIRLVERTLNDRERILGTNHPETLDSRNNLAGAYQAAGDLDRAIQLFERTLTDRQRVLGADHPDTLSSRSNLAAAYEAAGDLSRAIPLFVQTLADRERFLGTDRPATLASRNNLAYAYQAAGDLSRAISLYEQTLADRERVLGSDHPDTLSSRNNLAYAYQAAGDLSRAIPLHEQTLADRQRILGADHPNTLGSLNNLAYAYQAAGDVSRAIPLHEQTLADRERVLGSDHPDTLSSRNNLAYAYQVAGDLSRAIPLYEQTLADRQRILGADHPDTLTSRNNLGHAYQANGDPSRAVALHRRTVADRERVLGPDHPDTLTSRNNLAVALWAAGEKREAIEQMEAGVEAASRGLSAEHPLRKRLNENLDALRNAAQ